MPITEYDGGNVGSVGFQLVDDPKAGAENPAIPDDNDQDDGPGYVTGSPVPGSSPGVQG